MKRLCGSVPGWTLVLSVLLGGLSAQAQAQAPTSTTPATATPTRFVRVTTRAIPGDAYDTVVASAVETGVRTGGSATVTLRLLDSNGAIVAQTTGVVSDGVPLRLSYRAPSTAGLSAQVVIPLGATRLSAPVVTIERWNPQLPLTDHLPPLICHTRQPETIPPPDPVMDCTVERLNVTAR